MLEYDPINSSKKKSKGQGLIDLKSKQNKRKSPAFFQDIRPVAIYNRNLQTNIIDSSSNVQKQRLDSKQTNIIDSSTSRSLVIQGRWYVNNKKEAYWIEEEEEEGKAGRYPPEGYTLVGKPTTREGERRAPGYIHGTASIPEILESNKILGGSASSKNLGEGSKEAMKKGSNKKGKTAVQQDLHFFTTDESNEKEASASLGRIALYYDSSIRKTKQKKPKELSLAVIVRRGLPIPGVLVFGRELELLKGFHPSNSQSLVESINKYPVVSCDDTGFVELSKLGLTEVRLLNKFDLLSVIFILRMGGKSLSEIVPLVQWANEKEVTRRSIKEGLVNINQSVDTKLIEECLSNLLEIVPVNLKGNLNSFFGRTKAIKEILLAYDKFCLIGMNILSELELRLFGSESMPETRESSSKLRSSKGKMEDSDSQDVYSLSNPAYKKGERSSKGYRVDNKHDEYDESVNIARGTIELPEDGESVFPQYPITEAQQEYLEANGLQLTMTFPDGDCSISSVADSLSITVHPLDVRTNVKRTNKAVKEDILEQGKTENSTEIMEWLCEEYHCRIEIIGEDGELMQKVPQEEEEDVEIKNEKKLIKVLFMKTDNRPHFYGTQKKK